MFLSIITINLNNYNGLKNTFKSIISQSFGKIEYIVIDGGSTDGSLEFIKSNSHNINYFISEPDNGIYHAMNKGVNAANGNYLLFLNSGDTLFSSRILDEVVPEFKDEDLIYGNIKVIEQTKTWQKVYPSKLSFSYFLHDSLPHPATFIKRELFDLVGPYNEVNKIVSDWEFFILAVNKYNCSYKHIPITVSNFMFDGISSKVENDQVKKNEIERALNINFPTYISDYHKLEQLEAEFNKLQIKYDRLKYSRINKLNLKLKKLFSW